MRDSKKSAAKVQRFFESAKFIRGIFHLEVLFYSLLSRNAGSRL